MSCVPVSFGFAVYNCVVCFKLTTSTCPRCDHVAYCSTKCVKLDLERHAPYECFKMTRQEYRVFKRINTKLRARDASICYKHTGSLTRGFGIFAFRDLREGKVIVRERSFMIKSSAVCTHVPSIHQPSGIFDMFWSLDHDKTLATTTEREHSIISMNGIFTEDGNIHLTYLISRFGTSAGAGANAKIISDVVTGAHTVVTTCDVLCGEEILLEVVTVEPCEYITCCAQGRFFKTYKN